MEQPRQTVVLTAVLTAACTACMIGCVVGQKSNVNSKRKRPTNEVTVAEEGASLYIGMAKHEFAVSEPVVAVVRIENASNHGMEFENNYFRIFGIASEDSGTPVTLTQLGASFDRIRSGPRVLLAPGDVYERVLILSELADLTLGGEFVLTVEDAFQPKGGDGKKVGCCRISGDLRFARSGGMWRPTRKDIRLLESVHGFVSRRVIKAVAEEPG